MATITDVAKHARVSTYTVSSVLNRTARVSPELTQRVLEAVKALDYTINGVARSLQTRKTNTVGMLLPDIGNPFFAKVVAGVEAVCKRSGYSVLLGNTRDHAEEMAHGLGVFRSRQVDGLLLFMTPGGEQQVEALKEKKVAFVLMGRRHPRVAADTVYVDSHHGSRLATDHLIRKGHKRIGIMTGPSSISLNQERIEGWRESLHEAGLPADPALQRETTDDALSAQRAMEEMLALNDPPSAMFTGNFLTLTGVLRALKEKGIETPRQVEVASFDDFDWMDVFKPAVSTVVTPSYQMGERGMELLVKRMADAASPVEHVRLALEMRVRE